MTDAPPFDGLLIDAGGVLTTDVFPSMDAFCAEEGLATPSFRELYFGSPAVRRLLHRLELGELHHTQVEGPLAALLGLPASRAAALFPGLYRGVSYVTLMTDAVEALRRSGVRTGLLSNSWWFDIYDEPFYERAFDVQVISGRTGMRKPQPEIYQAALAALGLEPERVLFVDDFEENLPPATDLGMAVLLHDPADPARTVAALERSFAVTLR